MRIMAIDYGDAHTGIAVSDPTGLLAGYTDTITAYRPEVVAERIAALAAEHGAEELVLGAGAGLLYHTNIFGVIKEGDIFYGVVIDTKSGLAQIRAKVLPEGLI